MLLVVVMLIGTILMGYVVWGTMAFYTKVYNMFFRTKEDIDTKCEDVVSWYNEAAKKDIESYVNEKRGELIRRRILINAFKANATKSGSEFVRNMNRVKGITPPAAICGHLSESYLNAALSLAA